MKIMLCQTKQRERAQKENKLMLCPTISHNFIQDIDVMILTPFRSARRNWPWCCLVRQSSCKCGLKTGMSWVFCIARVLYFHDSSQSEGPSWNITRILLRNPPTAEFWHRIIESYWMRLTMATLVLGGTNGGCPEHALSFQSRAVLAALPLTVSVKWCSAGIG